MNQALLYRPNGKGALFVAFAFAAALHISAVAFAGHQRDPVPSVPRVIEIEYPPDDPPPAPPQEYIEPPPLPALSEDVFVEQAPPPRQRPNKPTGPIHPPTIGRIGPSANPKATALNAPRPDYPYEARSRHIMGSGVARLTIDSASGVVTTATMQQSTGSPVLDNSALSAFRRWRFRPGTPSPVIIPITYTMMGATY